MPRVFRAQNICPLSVVSCLLSVLFFLHLIFHLFLDWTNSLNGDFDWPGELCRTVSVPCRHKAVVSLFQTLVEMHVSTHTFVHLGIQICMHADSNTKANFAPLFTQHSNVMILNLNNWNGVYICTLFPKVIMWSRDGGCVHQVHHVSMLGILLIPFYFLQEGKMYLWRYPSAQQIHQSRHYIAAQIISQ